MKKNLSQPSQSWTHDWDNIIEKKVKKTRKSILNKIKCVKEELKKKNQNQLVLTLETRDPDHKLVTYSKESML